MGKQKASRSEKSIGKKDERTRNWVFLVYPDSVPENWRDVLDSTRIQWIESPLHDPDGVDDAGEDKQLKPHWHILLLFEGPKSHSQVKEITQKIKATIPIPCLSAHGTVRYMAHLDDPKKKQYLVSDIIGHCGADVAEYLKPTSAKRYLLIHEMVQWVVDNNVTEYWVLLQYADCERDDWFRLLSDSASYVMNMFIKSRRHYSLTEKAQNDRKCNAQNSE